MIPFMEESEMRFAALRETVFLFDAVSYRPGSIPELPLREIRIPELSFRIPILSSPSLRRRERQALPCSGRPWSTW
jgi:hypothetical protein